MVGVVHRRAPRDVLLCYQVMQEHSALLALLFAKVSRKPGMSDIRSRNCCDH